MAKNHPICNTPLVRELRKHYRNSPLWPEIYANLKQVYENCQRTRLLFSPNERLMFAFSWQPTAQGYDYWDNIERQVYG